MSDINRMYTWAIETCNASNVGYSQIYRNQQTVGGITYYDCSSFVNFALNAGGFETPTYAPQYNAFLAGTQEATELIRLGFTEVDATGEYMSGDIGVDDGHTEICYLGGQGEGTFMGAHNSSLPLIDQVSISNYTRSFDRLFRYGSGGAGGYGYSLSVISAMCGNFWTESHINPAIWESLTPVNWTDMNHGYGLGQWTNTTGSMRLYDLWAWLTGNNYSLTDGNAQCNYLVHENYWLNKPEYPQYTDLNSFLTTTDTDLTTLTHAWNWCWEGIHDASWDTRVTQAQQCYDYINAHAQDSTITAWIAENRFLSDDEKLNNAVMLYRYFSAGGGGGGSPTFKKSNMPLWMKIKYH